VEQRKGIKAGANIVNYLIIKQLNI